MKRPSSVRWILLTTLVLVCVLMLETVNIAGGTGNAEAGIRSATIFGPRVRPGSCSGLSQVDARLDSLNRRGTLSAGDHNCDGYTETECPN